MPHTRVYIGTCQSGLPGLKQKAEARIREVLSDEDAVVTSEQLQAIGFVFDNVRGESLDF